MRDMDRSGLTNPPLALECKSAHWPSTEPLPTKNVAFSKMLIGDKSDSPRFMTTDHEAVRTKSSALSLLANWFSGHPTVGDNLRYDLMFLCKPHSQKVFRIWARLSLSWWDLSSFAAVASTTATLRSNEIGASGDLKRPFEYNRQIILLLSRPISPSFEWEVSLSIRFDFRLSPRFWSYIQTS